MRMAIAGGTGTVGTQLVAAAKRRGHEAVVLSRSTGVDLLDTSQGDALARLLTGVDAVVDVSSTQTQSTAASRAFFGGVTRSLLTAEKAAEVPHHVALSIVGVDRAPDGYYAGKALQEQLIEQGEVPWTLLRATQFHEFARQLHGRVRLGPFVLVPVMRSQPVAASEVADRLIGLVEQGPQGRVSDLAGPAEEQMHQLVRRYGRSIGDRHLVVAVTLPGVFGKALRDGSVLAGPNAERGIQTFDAWLADQTTPTATPDRAAG